MPRCRLDGFLPPRLTDVASRPDEHELRLEPIEDSSSPSKEANLCSNPVLDLRVPLPDVVPMQTRRPDLEGAGEIPLRRLVKEALRMRPSRIVVGEVRQEEASTSSSR